MTTSFSHGPTPAQRPPIRRVQRSRAVAQASYDRLSRWYDLLAGSEHAYVDAGLSLLGGQAGETILVVGFGTGREIVTLAETVGASGRVCGIDLSGGMCRRAQERVTQFGLMERAVLVCGDAVALPWPAATFDALFMGFTLELFDTPEIPVVLGECRRVLRPGGRLGVVALAKPARPSVPVRLYEWAHEQIPHYVDCRPIYMATALAESGLQVTKQQMLSMWGLPVAVAVAANPQSG